MIRRSPFTTALRVGLAFVVVTLGFANVSLAAKVPNQSDADQVARQIFEATGITGGLVAHLGCGDGRLTAALRSSDSFVVQGLDADVLNVAAARKHLRSLGLYGDVSVRQWSSGNLPYVDNLVNLVVAEDLGSVSMDEVIRVLAPLGVAYVKQAGAWTKVVKPLPGDIDQWTHYLHGPGNNAVANDTVVGPPRHLQWLAGPRWTRTHHKLNTISAVVTAGGRIFYITDEATASNLAVPGKWLIAARDAFSGVLLWKKSIDKWASSETRFRSGPAQVTRLLIAEQGRVYAPLGLNAPISVLDAASGDTLATYQDTQGAEEMILIDGILLAIRAEVAQHALSHPDFQARQGKPKAKTLVAVDTASGKTLWKWSEPGFLPAAETLGADGGRVFAQVGAGVICWDLKTGDKRWTYGTTTGKIRGGFGVNVLVASQGVVLCNLGDTVTALDATDGRRLWTCPGGQGFHAPQDLFVIGDLVWMGIHPKDSVAPPPVDDFSVARDVRTGEIKQENQVMVDLQSSGHHHRCYRNKATTRFIAAGKRGIEMLDLQGENHSRNNWLRGTCQYGIMPANGLIYSPPHSCGCYMESKLWGFYAMAADRPVMRKESFRVPDDQRLQKGPAFGKIEPRDSNVEGSGDWPQFRHNPLRNGVAGTQVPTTLSQSWRQQVGGRLTQPVIADGRLVIASTDENTVYALDATSGERVWECVVGGRVDGPPAIHNGLVLFGCADGWVYCRRLDDGQLVWRFFAAPADLTTVALNQIESLWPVHGSVLVFNDVVYCCAGRSSWIDGGMVLYGLDPETGSVVCSTHLASPHPEVRDGAEQAQEDHNATVSQNVTDYRTFLQPDQSDAFSMAGGVVADVLGSDGRNLFLHHMCMDTSLEQQPLSRHLFSTSSLLDDTENHRSHWVLGTGDFSRVPVAYSWIANGASPTGLAAPFGLMMVFDDDGVWLVRRRGQSATYSIVERPNHPFSPDEEHVPDLQRIPKQEIEPPRWNAALGARPRAMVKSGDRLYLGCMPTELVDGDPRAAYEGRAGGTVQVVSTVDGKTLAAYNLPASAVWDGMAAANQRLYVATTSGEVICLGDASGP